jgi:hypothetical protein
MIGMMILAILWLGGGVLFGLFVVLVSSDIRQLESDYRNMSKAMAAQGRRIDEVEDAVLRKPMQNPRLVPRVHDAGDAG